MKTKIGIWTALTGFAALAFANNIVVIVRWWQAFLQAGGDSSQMPTAVPGLFPWLDWSAVDYSAVSTLIPLLGCFCVLRALVQVARGKALAGEHAPFFASADQLNVALGLFGTLWGIIVIGYFRLDKVSMGDLMHCLHTALFSTLIAVVWVFMIDHPIIRPWFRKLLLRRNLVATDGAPLATVVDLFIARLAAASEAFDARQKQFEETALRRQNEVASAQAERDRAFQEAFAKRQAETEAAFADRARAFEESFTKRQADADAAYAKRQAEAAAAFAAREQQFQEDYARREKAFAEACETRLAALKAAGEAERARHRQAEEQLTAQVAEARAAEAKADEARRAATARADEASARAVAAETRLEQARSALKG